MLSNKKFVNDFLSMPINIFGDESWLNSPQDFDPDVPSVPETPNYFGWYIEQQKWSAKDAVKMIEEPCSKTGWNLMKNKFKL